MLKIFRQSSSSLAYTTFKRVFLCSTFRLQASQFVLVHPYSTHVYFDLLLSGLLSICRFVLVVWHASHVTYQINLIRWFLSSLLYLVYRILSYTVWNSSGFATIYFYLLVQRSSTISSFRKWLVCFPRLMLWSMLHSHIWVSIELSSYIFLF